MISGLYRTAEPQEALWTFLFPNYSQILHTQMSVVNAERYIYSIFESTVLTSLSKRVIILLV